MALAWNMTRFKDPSSTRSWLRGWAALQFGDEVAENAASIMTTYGKLVARRKYEDLSMTPFAFSTANYDEAELNYAEWTLLVDQAQAVYDKLPSGTQPAFFELVLHPVLAGKTVFEIYTKAALGIKYASDHRASTNELAKQVQAAFSADQALKKRYHSLLGGKWNHFMDQTHLGYNNWQQPAQDSIPQLSHVTSSTGAKGGLMGVAVQGGTGAFPAVSTLTLGLLSPYTPVADKRWVDIFARDDGSFTYKITSNATYVSVSNAQGTVTSPTDTRSVITIDWDAAPSGSSVAALTITPDSAGGPAATVLLPVSKASAPGDFRGHVEAGGVVSMEAEHRDAGASSPEYLTIPDYGRTLSGVKLGPLTPSQTAALGPVLTYPFFTFADAAAGAGASLTVYLSPSENANPTSPNRYAFAVDGAAPTTVQPVPLANAGGEPAGWADGVIANAYVKTSKIGSLPAGKHVLKVWLLEPTMVLTKLVVDVGGLKASALGPPESAMVGG